MLKIISVYFIRLAAFLGLLFKTHLLINFALQLHDLVLHANVELLIALHGAGLDLIHQKFQVYPRFKYISDLPKM